MRIPHVEGRTILVGSWLGSLLFAITAVPAAVALGWLRYPAAAVAIGLFLVGCVVFLWAFSIGVERSRLEEVAVSQLFLLSGEVAPSVVKRHLYGSLAVQVGLGVATASVRPFTSLAFGILVPMYGLGLAGQWAARYGRFARRRELRRRKPKAR